MRKAYREGLEGQFLGTVLRSRNMLMFLVEFKMSMEELVAGCPLLIAKEQKDDADAEWCGSGFTRKEDGDVDFPIDFASKDLDAGGFQTKCSRG